MKQRQEDIFEKCIELLEAGASINVCFKLYPQLTSEMKTMLENTKDLLELGDTQIPGEMVEQSRARFMSNARRLFASKTTGRDTGLVKVKNFFYQVFNIIPAITPMTRKLVLIIGTTGLLILFSSGLVITSAKSLPGDSLYPVKRAVEDISVHIVPNHEIRNEYEDNYSHQRVVEVKRLLELNRMQKVAFEGILEATDGNYWMVSGIPVNLTSDTQMISGIPDAQLFELGSVIEVEGETTSQGTVSANEIHLREYKYIGTVDKIDTDSWLVSGNQIFISSGSQIDPDIRQGDDVTLLLRSEDDGLYALAILHDIRPTPNPFQSIGSITTATPESQDNEVQQLIGTLENITMKYWVVGGEIVFINNVSNLPDNIQIGDELSISYHIETNGSFTAIEVNKNVHEEEMEEDKSQVTPEGNDDKDEHDHPDVTTTPHEEDESEKTPETPSTPEPTEDH